MTTLNSKSAPLRKGQQWPPRRGEKPAEPRLSSELENFRLTLAALVGIACAALVIAAAVFIHDRNQPVKIKPAKWSSWSPGDSGDAGALDIADYVSLLYRQTVNQQFTVITPISTTSLDESTGAFTGAGLSVAESTTGTVNDLTPLPGKTVAYDLCGAMGPNCSTGLKPTLDLELFAKREALELALYTFKYIKGSSYVAVVLPRGLATGKNAASVTEAVLFSRKELAPDLSTPLADTLANVPPDIDSLKTWASSSEALSVELYTHDFLFTEKIAEQQGLTLLELFPLPAQA